MYNKSDNHIKETMLIIFMILFWGRKMSMKFHHDSKIMDLFKYILTWIKYHQKYPYDYLQQPKKTNF